jgi:DNA-binding TFAR19-related protein (PDSD5 family)
MAEHRRRTWFTKRAERKRRAALEAAARTQAAERQAAMRRVLEQATRRLPVVRAARPLLTPGQAARSQQATR